MVDKRSINGPQMTTNVSGVLESTEFLEWDESNPSSKSWLHGPSLPKRLVGPSLQSTIKGLLLIGGGYFEDNYQDYMYISHSIYRLTCPQKYVDTNVDIMDCKWLEYYERGYTSEARHSFVSLIVPNSFCENNNYK